MKKVIDEVWAGVHANELSDNQACENRHIKPYFIGSVQKLKSAFFTLFSDLVKVITYLNILLSITRKIHENRRREDYISFVNVNEMTYVRVPPKHRHLKSKVIVNKIGATLLLHRLKPFMFYNKFLPSQI